MHVIRIGDELLQAVATKIEIRFDRRRAEERRLNAALVDAMAGRRGEDRVRRHHAADGRRRLDDDDAEPGLREVARRREPVVPGSDDDDVGRVQAATAVRCGTSTAGFATASETIHSAYMTSANVTSAAGYVTE